MVGKVRPLRSMEDSHRLRLEPGPLAGSLRSVEASHRLGPELEPITGPLRSVEARHLLVDELRPLGVPLRSMEASHRLGPQPGNLTGSLRSVEASHRLVDKVRPLRSVEASHRVVGELRLLARFLRPIGHFPATIRDGRLDFSHSSPLSLYSCFIIIIVYVFIFSSQLTQLSAGRKMQLSSYGIQLLFKSFSCVLSFPKVCRLIELLGTADRLITVEHKSIDRRVWPLLSISIYAGSATIAFYFTYRGGVLHAASRLCLALVWQMEAQQVLLFAFFAYQIDRRFISVRGMLGRPERCRLAQATMVQCVRTLSAAFGSRFLISIIFIGTDYLQNVFMQTYLGGTSSTLILFLGVYDGFWAIYLPGKISSKIIEQGNAITDDIVKLPTAEKSKEYCQEVDQLLEVVRSSNLEITAWGVFKIDTGFYGSFINTLLTFFIAMAQFSNEVTALIELYNLND